MPNLFIRQNRCLDTINCTSDYTEITTGMNWHEKVDEMRA